MPRLTRRTPQLCYHRGTGQGYVSDGGTRLYLGVWPGGPAAPPPQAVLDAYRSFLAVRSTRVTTKRAPIEGLCIAEVAVAFLQWAEKEYRTSNEADVLKYAVRPLVLVHGREPIRDFGPSKLLGLQGYLVAEGRLTRQGINRTINRIRSMFKWATVREYYPGSTLEGLKAVPGLRAGRTPAREFEVRDAVSSEHVDAVLPHLQPVVADMVRLQLTSAARPGEIVSLTLEQMDRSDPEVWIFEPHRHKTAWRGKGRKIPFGPKAIAILQKYLRDDGKPLFSAAEAMAERRVVRRSARKSKVQPSQEDRRVESPASPAGDAYTVNSYRRAVERGCKAAGVPVWSPNQCRKSAATLIRSSHDLAHAQAVLGHSDAATTADHYAKVDLARIKTVARDLG